MQAVLYFIRSEIGSQWSCHRRGVQFRWRGALRIRQDKALKNEQRLRIVLKLCNYWPFETSHVYVHPTHHPKHISNQQVDFGCLKKKNLCNVCTALCFDNTHNSRWYKCFCITFTSNIGNNANTVKDLNFIVLECWLLWMAHIIIRYMLQATSAIWQ